MGRLLTHAYEITLYPTQGRNPSFPRGNIYPDLQSLIPFCVLTACWSGSTDVPAILHLPPGPTQIHFLGLRRLAPVGGIFQSPLSSGFWLASASRRAWWETGWRRSERSGYFSPPTPSLPQFCALGFCREPPLGGRGPRWVPIHSCPDSGTPTLLVPGGLSISPGFLNSSKLIIYSQQNTPKLNG